MLILNIICFLITFTWLVWNITVFVRSFFFYAIQHAKTWRYLWRHLLQVVKSFVPASAFAICAYRPHKGFGGEWWSMIDFLSHRIHGMEYFTYIFHIYLSNMKVHKSSIPWKPMVFIAQWSTWSLAFQTSAQEPGASKKLHGRCRAGFRIPGWCLKGEKNMPTAKKDCCGW